MPRKLLKFLILFDNSSLLYFPGQFLSGRVLLELQENTPVLEFIRKDIVAVMVEVPTTRGKTEIAVASAYSPGDVPEVPPPEIASFVQFCKENNKSFIIGCDANAHHTVWGSTDINSRGLHFHVVGECVVRVRSGRHERSYDKENYIDFRMRLLGDAEHQGPTVLSPGIHSFPFKLGLPIDLPSTFLGRYGWVQYYCKAALREPSGLIHKNHQVFIVMNPIDLNTEQPYLADPFKCNIEHNLGVACVGGGIVKCRIILDRGGYVPGESIMITATVTNSSSVTIKSTKAALTETIQYFAHEKLIQTEKRELAVIARGKIRPGCRDEWQNESLYVPPLPPTNLRGCHLIRIQYDVCFLIEPKSLEKQVKLQLPITLGTYPFKNGDGEDTNEWAETVYKPETHYPSTLPIFRPWLHEKADSK